MPKTVKFLTMLAGLFIALLGLGLGLFYVTFPSPPLEGGLSSLSASTVGVALIALGVGLGLALALQSWNALLGRASRLLRLPSWWVSLVAFILVIFMGQLVLAINSPASGYLFPPLHILGIGLPSLVILAFVHRRLAEVSPLNWREVVFQFSSGALLTSLGAFVLEGLAVLSLIAIILLKLSLTPGGEVWLHKLFEEFQAGMLMQDVFPLFSPLFLFILAFVVLAVAPAVEELMKAVGVVLMAYRQPNKARAFAWGMLGGLGFSVIEGIFNTAMAIEGWPLMMVTRMGATLMHALTGGWMGIGWHGFVLAGRPWRVAGTYLASLCLHFIWNLLATSVVGLSLWVLSPEMTQIHQALGGLAILVLMGLFGLLTLALCVLMFYTVERLRRTAKPAEQP